MGYTMNSSVPKTERWLEQREEDWKIFKSRSITFQTDNELEPWRQYFLTGDLISYIKNDEKPSLSTIFNFTPLMCFEEFKAQILYYWNWMLEKPNERGDFSQHPNLNDRLMDHLDNIFSFGQYTYVSESIRKPLFFWIYGEKYDPTREVELILNDGTWKLQVKFNPNLVNQKLIGGIREYIWGDINTRNINMYKDMIDYFLSIFTHVDKDCFSTKLPNKEYVSESGNKIREAFLIWPRWLLANLNGFTTEYEEEEGIKELKVNDQEALDYLRAGLDKLDMPKEYYELNEFVLRHKEDCLYSEE